LSLDINPGIRSRTITVAALLTSSLFTGGWLIVRGAHDNPATPAEAERLFAGIDAARARSPLKERPDEAAAHTLLMELHRSMLGI